MSQEIDLERLSDLQPGEIMETPFRYLFITKKGHWYVIINTLLKTKRFYFNARDVFYKLCADV